MTYFYLSAHRRAMLLLGLLMLGTGATAQQKLFSKKDSSAAGNEASERIRQLGVSARDTAGYFPNSEMYLRTSGAVSSVRMDEVRKLPYTSVNQMLLGRATGVDVRIPSAEPGKRTGAYVRGFSGGLMLKNGDVMSGQPLYVIDGVPLLLDHPFAFDIQRFDFNRMGTEIDPLTFIDVNTIESLEVLKDYAATAKYGPLAANGVIAITTRAPRAGDLKVEVSGYAGMYFRPSVDVINGRWERNFRMRAYEKYATSEQYRGFPAYLADSTNQQYYGHSDWDEEYYRNGWGTGLQASLSGGNRLANYRFGLGEVSQQGVADKTAMNRYNINFGINVTPIKGLQWTTYMAAGMAARKRNQSMRDRMGDQDYILSLERPPSPNKDLLEQYYGYLKRGLDRNRNNNIRVMNNLQATFSRTIRLNSRVGIDYTQNFRDLFIPTTVNDGNNFVSNFDGLQRRITFDNSIELTPQLKGASRLNITLGQYGQWDMWKYQYGRAYKGKSDYIQVYQPGTDQSKPGGSHNIRLTANFKDRLKQNLLSYYGDFDYSIRDKYFFNAYLRYDGSSSVGEAERWQLNPTLSAAWRISAEEFMKGQDLFSDLRLRASAGRVGRIMSADYYGGGPVYNVEVGWEGTPNMSTYDAFPVLNAAYELGYITPGLGWSYTDQLNGGLDLGFLKNRLRVSVDVYSKTDRQLLLKVPVMQERGYTGVIVNGMDIRNYGGELSVQAQVINNKTFGWTTTLNASANKTKLLQLPFGQQDVRLGNRRFLVGKPVDKYWLLINDGIYNTDAEVPAGMTYQGLPMKAGDPKWRDTNGDNQINDDDRVISGTHNPAVQGGWDHTFRYRKLELNFLLSYALGRKLLNKSLADRFDFVNNEGADAISAVKEVSFWSRPDGDLDAIPLYNPWSPVRPYQTEQTLFLEDASFVKLRSASLTYNFSGPWMSAKGIQQLRVFVTGTNLLTWTKYTGGDPEAVDYFGYDLGAYNWAAPKSFTLGFNLQFK
ncbi:SusC/RagA family TonB-linked outer membrane protein [Chitinophaga lutea]